MAAVTAYIARNEHLKNKTVELINSGKLADTFTNGENVGKTIFPKQQGKMSPELNAIFSNPDYIPGEGNCAQCVTALELRSRGLDVKAKAYTPASLKLGEGTNLEKLFASSFKNAEISVIEGDYGDKMSSVANTVSTWADNSRGYIAYNKTKNNPAHIFTVVKENGVMKFLEPQTGYVAQIPEMKEAFKSSGVDLDNLNAYYGKIINATDIAVVIRTDNAEIKKGIFKNVKKGG